MSDKVFFDTNIWIYAHIQQPGEARCMTAAQLVAQTSGVVVSTQILNEYYSVALKNRAADAWIQANIEAMISRCEVLPVTVTILRSGHRLKLAHQISLWDAFVVAAALESGCSTLYSEDLQPGQVFDGRLKVVNPFL